MSKNSLAIALANSLDFANAIKLAGEKGTLNGFSNAQRAMLRDQMQRFGDRVRAKIHGATEMPYDAANEILKERREHALRLAAEKKRQREEREELLAMLGQ